MSHIRLTADGITNYDTTTIEEDLNVSGDSVLGEGATDAVAKAGDTVISGEIQPTSEHVKVS